LNNKLDDLLEGLLPSNMLKHSSTLLGAHLKLIRDLFKQRLIPKSGWPDVTITFLLKLLSIMDSDKDPEGVKIGEREARVASPLISDLASGFCHGVGRSGSLIAPQPKALGGSILHELANRCALDAIRKFGAPNVNSAVILPVATGMSISLALAAARDSSDEDRKIVVYPRADHNSPLKAINYVGLKPRVVEGKVYGDAVRMPVDKIAEAIDKHCCAVLSTTTFFPPREADSIKEIAKIASEKNVFHIINNAYGVQSREIMRAIRSAIDSGRVDAIVQSTDKNFLTPVGGAIIASPDGKFVEKASSQYCGRASASPIYQFLAAVLSLGIDGYEKLRNIQESNRTLLQKYLSDLADSNGERLLSTRNPIARAMTITKTDPNTLAGILYSLRLSGPRVVASGSWGSCCDNYPYSYVVMNAAIGSSESDISKAIEKLKEGINQARTKKGT
jgi:O-phospho-L-seryl-tRNASec:L-selenocysteinyl-tRNA synthase